MLVSLSFLVEQVTVCHKAWVQFDPETFAVSPHCLTVSPSHHTFLF